MAASVPTQRQWFSTSTREDKRERLLFRVRRSPQVLPACRPLRATK